MAPTTVDFEVPFGSFFAAAARGARREIPTETHLLSESALDHLERGLTNRLARTGGRALLSLFEAEASSGADSQGDRRYRRFVDHLATERGRDELAAGFPVLEGLLESVAQQWIETTGELVAALDDDAELLTKSLGVGGAWFPIVEARSGLGDPHRGGRMVMGLTPTVGRSVAFKPRPFAAEAALYALLGEVACEGLDEDQTLWAADRGEHGWMAWIEARPVSDPTRYWRNAGRAAAVLHLAGAVDLHHGNVVAAGDTCVPLDLECSGLPILENLEEPEASGVDSILTTGLFPAWFGGDGTVAREVCGLFGDGGRTAGFRYARWEHLGTDRIGTSSRLGFNPLSRNRPVDREGRTVPLDIDALLDGIESTLRQLADGRLFEPFGEAPSRLLFRGTGTYAGLIDKMLDPDTLADGETFRRLSESLPLFADGDWRSELLGRHAAEFRAGEAAALRRLDVPLFRACGTDLELDDGRVLRETLVGSGALRRQRRLGRLNPAGIALQRSLVALTVEQATGVHPTAPSAAGPPDPDTSAVEAATRIGDQLLAEQLGERERPGWLELDPGRTRRAFSAGISATDAYSGADGIGMFFAALWAATGESKWRDAARTALWQPRPGGDAMVGWPSGWAGYSYARLFVGRVLHDDALVAEAVACLDISLRRAPSLDCKLDLVGGWVGLLEVGLAAIESGHGERLRLTVARLAEQLASAADVQWTDDVRGRALRALSTAHGGTGVAHGLLRAAATLGVRQAGRAGERIVVAENERVEKRAGVGAALVGAGAAKSPRPGWCWGAGGYLAMRTSRAFEDRRDLCWPGHLVATVAALRDPVEARSGLCCGQSGSLVAVHGAARRGIDGAAQIEGALTAALIDQATGRHPYRFVPPSTFCGSSLFMGRAGVGYALARVSAPDRVPNVLTVE